MVFKRSDNLMRYPTIRSEFSTRYMRGYTSAIDDGDANIVKFRWNRAKRKSIKRINRTL